MSIKLSESGSYSVRAAVALILGAAAMMASAGPVAAADNSSTLADDQTAAPAGGGAAAAAPVNLEEVTVTGTRIRRRDLQALSPLVTVDSSQIESTAGLNVQQYLNQMPQYAAAQTPTTENLDVQPSAVNTVGISTISLRGFGPNRSLVLIDGHRTTPVNELMVTDIDSIPTSMIDRVETITGGASATYGADALGGVTNFILKKNFQGASIDAQDGMSQADDNNVAAINGIMGTNFADGKGNVTMGLEWYNRTAAYQKNRSFYTDAWSDPYSGSNALGGLFNNGYNGIQQTLAPASNAAMNALFPVRAASGLNACSAAGCIFNAPSFNYNGSLFMNGYGVAQGNNWQGTYTTLSGGFGPNAVNGFGPHATYDAGVGNSAIPNAGVYPAPPPVDTTLSWNNPVNLLSLPQTRYSFFANGHYDFADDVQFYMTSRFSSNKTSTLLSAPETATYGWEASVPFNAVTDSPINPALINSATSQAALTQIYNAFTANPNSNAYTNPNFIAHGAPGAQHPVPWQLSMLLLSRSVFGAGIPLGVIPGLNGTEYGGPAPCPASYSVTINGVTQASPCSVAPTSWVLEYTPGVWQSPQRSTIDYAQSWQIETGFKFPLHLADWTGELYYSRGQSTDIDNGYGSESLERWRAVITAPDYGNNAVFQGNALGAAQYFGSSTTQNCAGGYYGAIFNAAVPSDSCLQSVNALLPAETFMNMDIVEANFNGSIFKLPAGEVSAAVGFQGRRVSGEYNAALLQSGSNFTDQAIGLYPQGSNNNQIISRDGYGELFIPIVKDLGVKSVDLDIGGRYSSYDVAPSATTFKVNLGVGITQSIQFRGGFNRATRAPNLGELYLPLQEYIGAGSTYGDPCSVRSLAPFGAGGAAPDHSIVGGGNTTLASGQTAAGANSAYLICQALMGAAGAAQYYGPTNNQGGLTAPGFLGFLQQEGNQNLTSETANTWTAGFTFNNLGQSPWISGLNGSIDWWQISIKNAIELYTIDYANYLCIGAVQVTTAAQAAAQAASTACLNTPRNQGTGGAETQTEQYSNLATIGEAGVDFAVNWLVQLSDVGLKVPGAFTFNTQDSLLQYYRTKGSGASFDVLTNWKDSFGPDLAGTNGGAFGYRLTGSFGYVLPSVSVNLQVLFYPSMNQISRAQTEAVIQNNNVAAKNGAGAILNYTPDDSIAAPAWYQLNLTSTYTVNSWLQLRGGIDNLLNKDPPITTATTGFTSPAQIAAACTAATTALGCRAPAVYSLPVDGSGNGFGGLGYYDVYGRTFFFGFKASF
jgi:iron complex outermembrane recepter protein